MTIFPHNSTWCNIRSWNSVVRTPVCERLHFCCTSLGLFMVCDMWHSVWQKSTLTGGTDTVCAESITRWVTCDGSLPIEQFLRRFVSSIFRVYSCWRKSVPKKCPSVDTHWQNWFKNYAGRIYQGPETGGPKLIAFTDVTNGWWYVFYCNSYSFV